MVVISFVINRQIGYLNIENDQLQQYRGGEPVKVVEQIKFQARNWKDKCITLKHEAKEFKNTLELYQDITNSKTFRVLELEDENQMLTNECEHWEHKSEYLENVEFEKMEKMFKVVIEDKKVAAATENDGMKAILEMASNQFEELQSDILNWRQTHCGSEADSKCSSPIDDDPELLEKKERKKKSTDEEDPRVQANDNTAVLCKVAIQFTQAQKDGLKWRQSNCEKMIGYWRKMCDQKIDLVANLETEMRVLKDDVERMNVKEAEQTKLIQCQKKDFEKWKGAIVKDGLKALQEESLLIQKETDQLKALLKQTQEKFNEEKELYKAYGREQERLFMKYLRSIHEDKYPGRPIPQYDMKVRDSYLIRFFVSIVIV